MEVIVADEAPLPVLASEKVKRGANVRSLPRELDVSVKDDAREVESEAGKTAPDERE